MFPEDYELVLVHDSFKGHILKCKGKFRK
jgi:hypothetical protein